MAKNKVLSVDRSLGRLLGVPGGEWSTTKKDRPKQTYFDLNITNSSYWAGHILRSTAGHRHAGSRKVAKKRVLGVDDQPNMTRNWKA